MIIHTLKSMIVPSHAPMPMPTYGGWSMNALIPCGNVESKTKPMTPVTSADQRNNWSARRRLLANRAPFAGFVRFGQRLRLHEVEIVEEADPHDAGQVMEPAR